MSVVDASAMIEVLLRRPKAERVEAHLRDAGRLDVPHLIDIEVALVLRRLVLSSELPEARAAFALDAQAQFRLRRQSHAALLPRVWLWRNTLSAYDAAYVALASARVG